MLRPIPVDLRLDERRATYHGAVYAPGGRACAVAVEGAWHDASLLRPVDLPSMNAVFPRLTDVQLQRLFGDGATSTLPSDVCDVLENMERMCQKLT